MATKHSLLFLCVLAPLVVGSGAITYRLHRGHSALAARNRKAAERDSAELEVAVRRRTIALTIDALRIEDRIAALSSQPAKNGFAIVEMERKLEADALLKSFQDTITKQLELRAKVNPDADARVVEAEEALVDAYIARRQVSLEGDESTNRAAEQTIKEARQQELAAIEEARKKSTQ
jgi:hypothetical protein